MTIGSHPVTVRQFPGHLCHKSARAFLREMRSDPDMGRPRIVINCSGLRAIDLNSMDLLLCCLEEAMKHKGDVKLAAVSDEVKALFESTGLSRLFEIFETEVEAVSSFQRQQYACAKQRVAGTLETQAGVHSIPYPPLMVAEMIRSEQ